MTQSNVLEQTDAPSPHQRLFRAILNQAIEDALAKDPSARNWFKHQHRTYCLYCDLAGFEPEALAERVLRACAEKDNAPPKAPRLPIKRTPRDPSTYKAKRYQLNGQTLTLREWSALTGVSVNALRSRLQQNWPLERVFTELARQRSAPGVGQDFIESEGTGGGSRAQDRL